MGIFSWKDEYCVGDAKIDSQHRYLFALANEMVDSKDKADLTSNAMKLFRYVREHFDHEEAVMRQHGYAGYGDHAAAHIELIIRLSEISSNIGKDRWSLADVQSFMNHWLLTHILEEDTKLVDLLHT